MEVASWSAEMEFSLTGKEGYETIEGVALFKYLWRTLEQLDNNWPVVRRNIGKSRQVWDRLGFIMRREGGVSVHVGGDLHSSRTGGPLFWSRDVDPIIGYRE